MAELDRGDRAEALRSARSRGWTELLERERESSTIREALHAAERGTGGALLLDGPPGIGKSAVLALGLRFGEAARALTLRARCLDTESEFEFGVVRQLFEPAVSRQVDGSLFDGAAALARGLFEPGHQAPREGAQSIVHGLFWLTSNLASQSSDGHRSIVLGVDDAQWCDSASLRFLVYLLQRIDDLRVTLLLTARPAARNDDPMLTRVRNHPLMVTLALDPLTRPSVAQLVRSGYFPEASDAFCKACFEVSGGNPFLLRALLEEHDAQAGFGDEAARRIARLMPPSVMRSVISRIVRLRPVARDVATAIAVLGDDAPLPRVAALAHASLDDAAHAVHVLQQEGILSEAAPARFAHALVRAAVLEDVSSRSRHLHTEAARLLHEDGEMPEAVSAQLLQGQPAGERWAVETLRESARSSVAFGAPDVAVRQLRRALEEPMAAEVKGAILLELGRAQALAGDKAALQTLEQAQRVAGSNATLIEILHQSGRVLNAQGRHADAAKAFETALDKLGATDSVLARELWTAAFAAGSMVALTGTGRWSVSSAALPENPQSLAERSLLAQLAVQRGFAAAPADETRRLATRAWSEGRLLDEETSDGMMWPLVTAASALAGDHIVMLEMANCAMADARKRGSVLSFATASYIRGAANFFAGRMNDAVADEQQALDMRRYDWHMYELAATAFLSRALIEQGKLDDAGRALDEMQSGFASESAERSMLELARAELMRARGRHEEALEDYCRARDDSSYVAAPHWVPWREGAVASLLALGRREEAGRHACEFLELAERIGAPGPIGRGLRLQAAIQSGSDAVATYEKAIEALRQSDEALALVHAQYELGALKRRAGRAKEARQHLEHAMRRGAELGAYAVVEQARAELHVAGARPRRAAMSGWDSLTPQEQRVARMAASGMSNREIAQALFVTVKAVEWHLGNAYQKLNVRSRRGLPDAMRSPFQTVTDS